jgi:hypothetical protein
MPQVGQRRIFADFFFAGIEGVPALGQLFLFMLQREGWRLAAALDSPVGWSNSRGG